MRKRYECPNCDIVGEEFDFIHKCWNCRKYYCFMCAPGVIGEICPFCAEARFEPRGFGRLVDILIESPSGKELSSEIKRYIKNGVPLKIFLSASNEKELRNILIEQRKPRKITSSTQV